MLAVEWHDIDWNDVVAHGISFCPYTDYTIRHYIDRNLETSDLIGHDSAIRELEIKAIEAEQKARLDMREALFPYDVGSFETVEQVTDSARKLAAELRRDDVILYKTEKQFVDSMRKADEQFRQDRGLSAAPLDTTGLDSSLTEPKGNVGETFKNSEGAKEKPSSGYKADSSSEAHFHAAKHLLDRISQKTDGRGLNLSAVRALEGDADGDTFFPDDKLSSEVGFHRNGHLLDRLPKPNGIGINPSVIQALEGDEDGDILFPGEKLSPLVCISYLLRHTSSRERQAEIISFLNGSMSVPDSAGLSSADHRDMTLEETLQAVYFMAYNHNPDFVVLPQMEMVSGHDNSRVPVYRLAESKKSIEADGRSLEDRKIYGVVRDLSSFNGRNCTIDKDAVLLGKAEKASLTGKTFIGNNVSVIDSKVNNSTVTNKNQDETIDVAFSDINDSTVTGSGYVCKSTVVGSHLDLGTNPVAHKLNNVHYVNDVQSDGFGSSKNNSRRLPDVPDSNGNQFDNQFDC